MHRTVIVRVPYLGSIAIKTSDVACQVACSGEGQAVGGYARAAGYTQSPEILHSYRQLA